MRRKAAARTEKALSDRRFILISLILAILILTLSFIGRRLSPVSFDLAKAYASEAVINAVNDSVSEYFSKNSPGYSDLVRLRFGSSGMVSAIEYDSPGINRIKTECTEILSKKLSKLKTVKIKLPAGSLFGDMSLSGKGPEVGVKLAIKAFCEVELRSELNSAGVNQSRHEIIMRVNVTVSMVLPPKTESFTVTQDYVLAQTVIAGDVPSGNLLID